MQIENIKQFWDFYRQRRNNIFNFDTFYARFFGPDFWGPHQKRMELLLESPLQDPILEAGCGAGCFTYALRKRGLKPIGVDLLSEQIAQSKLFFEYAKLEGCWVQSNLLALPFADGFFSSVIAFDILEHILELSQTLKEIHRILKPGGILFVTIPNGWGSYCLFEDRYHKRFNLPVRRFLKRFLWRHSEDHEMESVATRHVHLHRKSWWQKCFLSHGFAEKRTANLEFISTSLLTRGGYEKNRARSEKDVKLAEKLPSWLASEWFFRLEKIV